MALELSNGAHRVHIERAAGVVRVTRQRLAWFYNPLSTAPTIHAVRVGGCAFDEPSDLLALDYVGNWLRDAEPLSEEPQWLERAALRSVEVDPRYPASAYDAATRLKSKPEPETP